MSSTIKGQVRHHKLITTKNYNQMKTRKVLIWVILLSAISMHFSQSNASPISPISDIMKLDKLLNITGQWSRHWMQSLETRVKLSTSTVLAGTLCFMAASISSAGGIGGGGLFIPILTIVSGLDLKTASSFSAFMVTGGSIANVMCYLFATSTKFGGKTLIDYDIALLSEPCMLLGVSIGVVCNLVFPEWLITILFAVFLVWSTFKTCKTGFIHWRLESEEVERKRSEICIENGLVKDGSASASEEANSAKEPLLAKKVNCKLLRFPWMKLGVLILIWFSFSFLYLLRGNRRGKGIIPMESCGMVYWILSFLQIPLAVLFTVWMLIRKENCQRQKAEQQDVAEIGGGITSNKFIFPLMALLAGVLGGLFGIGGGMLVSPLLLHVGLPPEVTAATCSFMVFFSSTMSAFQYLFFGMEHVDTALIFAIICFVASLLGLLVIQRAIRGYGRASLIVFSVSTVMVLSTLLMTSFGALDVWRDYKSGKNMGFKLPC